jgi:translation initiation factor 2B subunit (eIF-2B alpha/beta/delta family)
MKGKEYPLLFTAILLYSALSTAPSFQYCLKTRAISRESSFVSYLTSMGSIEEDHTVHHEVVSNLLFKAVTSDEPLVIIFQRNKKVFKFPKLTASRSGNTINKCSSSDAALHLKEDTGLLIGKGFELYLRGKPYEVWNEGVRTTVYPFSWILKDASKPFPGGTELEWLHPMDILDGKHDRHIIRPSQSIWRVWLRRGGLFSNPGAQHESEHAAHVLHERLLAMKTDQESGARYMATTALLHLHDVLAAATTTPNGEILWLRTRMIAWHLIHNGRPSMNAAVGKSLLSCLWRLWFLQDSRLKMLEVIRTCIEERQGFSRRIGESFAAFIQRHFRERFEASSGPLNINVLTLSSSITKSALLIALKTCHVTFDVRILESRPLCEGAEMASMLVKQAGDCDSDRLKITIATDASVALMAKDVDLVLLGADRISDNGDVSNKTGSYPAALCARALGNISSISPKVVVLSGIEKVAKPGAMDDHDEEDNGPLQIWRIWELAGCKKEAQSLTNDHRVEFKNVAFEWVPANCVDVYISEDGEITREKIKEQSSFMEKLDNDVFGDL